VILEDILITDVNLPPKVRAAIEAKIEQAQVVEECAFREGTLYAHTVSLR
jgi:regulator of protease activity HflC (stomatin/prohibitin superfamily)